MRDEQKNLSLPAPEPSRSSRSVDRYAVMYQAQAEGSEPDDSASAPLSHYFWVVRRHIWSLLAFVAVAVACTVIVSLRLTPYYQATATIDVDRLTPTGILGQESTVRNGGTLDTDQFLSTQIELIKSDSVLRPVAQRLKMPPKEIGKPVLATAHSE